MKNLLCSKRGQVFVLLALVLVLMLAITGLAIDAGIAYVVKTKLNTAVDAAAIAAGRVVGQGDHNISDEAANFFKANDPTGVLGAVVQDPTTIAHDNGDGTWTVSVTATALSPTYFAKVIGVSGFTVQANATSRVRTADIILVIDCSGSIGASNSLLPLQKAAQDFVNSFNTGNDRVGLIHFASGAVQDVSITTTRGFDKDAISRAIQNLSAAGATTSEEAMRLAKAQLDLPSNQQSNLRAIVFFTDGSPNGVAGNFQKGASNQYVTGVLYSTADSSDPNILSWGNDNCGSEGNKARWMFDIFQQDSPDGRRCSDIWVQNNINFLPDTDYTGDISIQSYNNMRTLTLNGSRIDNSLCNVNRAARNMLENVANAARSEANGIHIFSIGLGPNLTNPEPHLVSDCGYGSAELGVNILKRIANTSDADTYNPAQPTGVYAYAQTAADLDSAFNAIKSYILRITK